MTRRLLLLIVAVYVVIALGYAFATPRWQNPDEPAHYNYARQIAGGAGLPVLSPGDYDQKVLLDLTSSKFAGNPDLSMLRYEDYQPPLYYVIGAVAMDAVPGMADDLYALRLISVVCGALVLVAIYAIARELVPEDPVIALAAAAFVAFIPQHMAMAAAANNDLLGELLLSLMVLLSIRRLKSIADDRMFVVAGAALLGLAFLTKATAYAGAVILAAAELARWRLNRTQSVRSHIAALAGVAFGALLIGGWWFVRNAAVYGHLDILGEQRHDQVVVGQLRTVIGLPAIQYFLRVGFDSFWGQFGWMGVLIDSRMYLLLAVLTGIALLGIVVFLARTLRSFSQWQRWALGLLMLELAIILGLMVSYNLKFVQPQGRYLFPASAAIGVFAALGLREMVSRSRLLALMVAAASLFVGFAGDSKRVLVGGLLVAGAIGLLSLSAGPRQRAVVWTGLFAALAVLDVICLVWYIVPALAT